MRVPRNQYRTQLLQEAFSLVDAAMPFSGALTDYLHSANMEVLGFGAEEPLTLRLTHFPQTSIGFVSGPAVRIRWNRDEASRLRAILVLAREGRLAVRTRGVHLLREGRALLLPAGREQVEVATTGRHNELVYVSVGASVIPARRVTLARHLPSLPLVFDDVSAPYSFLRALCGAELTKPYAALQSSTETVVTALARILLPPAALDEKLTLQARAFVEQHHANAHITPRSIADHLDVSPRTLQVAFAAEGTTLVRVLSRIRARTALRLSEKHLHLSAAQRAHQSGFSSVSAMYRAVASVRAREEELSANEIDVGRTGEL